MYAAQLVTGNSVTRIGACVYTCGTASLIRRGCAGSKRILAALTLVALLGSGRSVQAAEAPIPAPFPGEEQVWNLAEALLAEGEYYRAVTEYKRVVNYFPGGAHATEAQERIGLALILGGEPRQALKLAEAQLQNALPSSRDRWLVIRAIAWMDLDAEEPFPLRRPNIDHARSDLRAVSPAFPDRSRLDGFLTALNEPPDAPRKSPLLAGTLSAVLPGSGSLYVGRYAEGALTFFLNALLISGTATAFHEHQEGLGVGLGVLALAFYGGGIYAAASGAHKSNDRADATYLDRQRVRFGLTLERGRIGAAFERNF
jgi:hypothetical protein